MCAGCWCRSDPEEGHWDVDGNGKWEWERECRSWNLWFHFYFSARSCNSPRPCEGFLWGMRAGKTVWGNANGCGLWISLATMRHASPWPEPLAGVIGLNPRWPTADAHANSPCMDQNQTWPFKCQFQIYFLL